MRVCLLTRFFSFKNAGLGRVSKEIAAGLVKKGHSIQSISTNGSSLYSYFYYTLVDIKRRLPKNCDIYHALTPMEAIWLPRDRGVVIFHDLFQITDPNKLGSGLGYSSWKNLIGTNYFKLAAGLAKRCKGIVAVSEKTKQDLVEYLGIKEDKIKVITSGINSDLNPQPRRDRVSRIGYLGQLDRRKRVNLLIDAFKQSSLDELVIGGVGVDEALLRERAAGDSRIKFLGLIPDSELVNFYNSLDAFVFPTWLEGYGLPIVEAMACKKSVIVLSDAKIPKEVKERCISVANLGEALKDPLNQSFRLTIEDNYKWAKEHSWDRTVEKYIELYEEILNG